MESAVGQEVVHCLCDTYHRGAPIEPNMNLELDLGFDSMERVELLASLEQTLNLKLPEDFSTEVFTVRDLIVRMERQTGVLMRPGGVSRQSWRTILSEESLDEGELHLSGTALSIFKYVCLRLVYCLVFRTLLRLETHGLKHLPKKEPYLICANHQSYLDPFVLVSTLPYRVFRKMFFVGYSVFFDSWFMKLAARLTNIVPVDPDAHLLRAMKTGAYGLRRGLILCIFPEGGRSFDGQLQEFKKGAAILARELTVPMVPVGIQGTHQAWPRDSVRIRPHKVKVTFGPPILPSPSSAADPYQGDTDRLRDSIVSLIREQPHGSGALHGT
jgi:long-chain acyl-CoA synthetase